MAVATLTPTVASVRAAKPSYVYGATATVPLQTSASSACVRVGMPSDIPANAVVASAILTVYQQGAVAGTNTLTVQRHSAAWQMSKVTWNNRPNVGGVGVNSPALTASADRAAWTFDVTTDVAAFVAGTAVNYGWRLFNSGATLVNTRGSAASILPPQLVITYYTPADPPIGLVPGGNQAVSVAKPWLTFQAPPDTTAINVQIDADATSPYDYDSGDVATTVGAFDPALAAAWAGLTAGGASAYWRARTKSVLGYSGFSSWQQFRRVAKGTVTITSPGATSDDTTPPIVWTFAGGTQVAWQVVITNAQGKLLADSGRQAGTATTYTPPKAVTTLGTSATVEVRVWDNVDRVATSGDDVYAKATLTFTAQGTGAVTPATSITAVPNGFNPSVVITAARAAAPDSWSLVRDNVVIATGLNPASAAFSYTDWTADPNKPHVYRAAPFTSGTGTASGGPTATATPRCKGIWLIDPANTAIRAVIWGKEDGSFDATELAVVHQPIAGPPVRRVAYRPPLSGSVSGELVDVSTYTADAQITALYDFKADNRDLVLVLGDRALTVRIGDLLVYPNPDSDVSDRHSGVSFSWWEQGTPPWSP